MIQGKGLVGTVSELSLVRRAQLAVTAHIRHSYTDYDLLLKSMRWREARQAVQQQCLDLLVQWRGDDDDDGEMADILQEVIVISDDEDDEDQQDPKSLQMRRERSDSVEFLSADDFDTQTVDYAAATSKRGQVNSLSPESDDADAARTPGYVPLSHGPPVHYNPRRLHEMGAHRHRMWEEAVDRRRKNPGLLYATDKQPPLPAPERLGQDIHQMNYPRQQGSNLHPYDSELSAHISHRPAGDSRLVLLPLPESLPRHGFESRSGEPRIFEQVSALPQSRNTATVCQDYRGKSYQTRNILNPCRVLATLNSIKCLLSEP